MKKTLLAFVLTTLGTLITPDSGYTQIQVGSGPDSSFLVVEAAAFGAPLVYQWNYTYNVSAPPSTADMITAVDLVSLELNFTILYSGTFLDSIEHSSLTLTNASSYPYSPFWAQWVSGGTSGSPLVAKPSGVWSAGYGITYRELAPGSWDGFIFNGVYDSNPPYDVISLAPSVAPVPESSSLILLTGAILLLLIRARKRLHAC
ncbi:MAG: PEP-CTERM sorting domain-containing protein [Verrucomicrobia bacterium]|nr:PEP-CTERM sorting domain-containing protein [Verrucomicrobiota bacterium]